MSMALGMGVGLPFGMGGRRLPPQVQALRFWGEPSDLSGADIASWTGRAPGNVTFTAAGGERPDKAAAGLVFNGSDRMNLLASTLGLGGATKATVAFWVKINSAAFVGNDTIFSSADYPNGIGLANSLSTQWRWITYIGGASRNGTADNQQLPDGWQFVCASYDGTQATDDARVQVYTLEHGQTVPTTLTTIGASIPTALPSASGNAAIGDLPPFGRTPAMTLGGLYVYRDFAAAPADALTLARLSDPLAAVPAVMALGDSIPLGVGDGDNNGGYRGDLLGLAGSNERWWFVGTTKNYPANAPNNRHEAVGGSEVDAHLTQFNSAVAAGWDPSIIIYCGGRNDINNGKVALLPARYAALFAAFGGRRAIVHVVPPSNPTTADTATANGYLATAAASYPNITIVDGNVLSPADMADASHPNAGGYAKMAGAIWTPFSAHV
jgi:lysophospholipase L1-like esterase